MIKTKLKHHFIQKKIDKLLTSQKEKVVASHKKINSVGIITDELFSRNIDVQNVVVEKLGLRNPKIYTFRNFEKTQEKSFKHFSEEDFNWKGDVLDTSVSGFVEQSFDLLICFYGEKNLFLEYVTLQSQAAFKVGFISSKIQSLDLEIAVTTEDIDDFFEETKKYLTILGKL